MDSSSNSKPCQEILLDRSFFISQMNLLGILYSSIWISFCVLVYLLVTDIIMSRIWTWSNSFDYSWFPERFEDLTINHMSYASSWYACNVMRYRNMDPRYVIRLPLNKQCEYADPITRKYHAQMYFLPIPDVSTLNACAIGNLAWSSRFNPEYLYILDRARKQ